MIWYFRGNQLALDFIADIPYEHRVTSSLCIMELIQGCRNKREITTVRKFAKENIVSIIHPDEGMSNKAISLLEQHASPDGLRTVDSIIAATALNSGAGLASGNFKHFKNIPNLKIIKFSPI